MTAVEQADTPRHRRRKVARAVAAGLAMLKTALAAFGALFFLAESSGQDQMGRGLSEGFAVMIAVYWILTVLPALVLAIRDRLIGLCFVFLLLPDVVLYVLIYML